jgi:hypothetical protein
MKPSRISTVSKRSSASCWRWRRVAGRQRRRRSSSMPTLIRSGKQPRLAHSRCPGQAPAKRRSPVPKAPGAARPASILLRQRYHRLQDQLHRNHHHLCPTWTMMSQIGCRKRVTWHFSPIWYCPLHPRHEQKEEVTGPL